MAVLRQIELIERFHLLMLSFLMRKMDKGNCALKGGCNLRFFFKSSRYSEDMDFDVRDITVHELRERVAGVLKSKPFLQAMAVHGMAIEHITESKQTATTQRWKLGLQGSGFKTVMPTKIEFSRRRFESEAVLENVDPMLVRAHGCAPLLVYHYPANIAWRQKVQALAGRSVTQARDVFDLNLLLQSGAIPTANTARNLDAELLAQAEERCLVMKFEDFKGQVLAFLTPELQKDYDDPAVWDRIVLNVAEALRKTP